MHSRVGLALPRWLAVGPGVLVQGRGRPACSRSGGIRPQRIGGLGVGRVSRSLACRQTATHARPPARCSPRRHRPDRSLSSGDPAWEALIDQRRLSRLTLTRPGRLPQNSFRPPNVSEAGRIGSAQCAEALRTADTSSNFGRGSDAEFCDSLLERARRPTEPFSSDSPRERS